MNLSPQERDKLLIFRWPLKSRRSARGVVSKLNVPESIALITAELLQEMARDGKSVSPRS